MRYWGGYPTVAQKKAEPQCAECKRLLAGIDRIAHSAFHWQALAQARQLLQPKDDK